MAEAMNRREGGCLCKAVRFVAAGEPKWVAHCHCESCRRTTGSPFTTYAGFHRGQVSFHAGQARSYASSPGVKRGFCDRCGTPLAYEGARWPDEIHLFVATFDQPETFAPKAHVNTGEQLPWIHLDDGLPRLAATS